LPSITTQHTPGFWKNTELSNGLPPPGSIDTPARWL
jgi:hypothetical protein